MRIAILALVTVVVAGSAKATTIDFDGFEKDHVLVSDQFSDLGVLFGSGPDYDPNLDLTIQVADFATNVGTSSGSSEPWKLVGALPNGQACASCSIIVSFLDPIPQEVTLAVTDPDVGQRVLFIGDTSVLRELVLQGTNSNVSATVSFSDPAGIRQAILITRAGVGIGMDDLHFGNPVPEPSTAALVALGLVGLGARRWIARG